MEDSSVEMIDWESLSKKYNLPSQFSGVPKNKNIAQESISVNQYKTKMCSFKTTAERLKYWIKAAEILFWEKIGNDSKYTILWKDMTTRPTGVVDNNSSETVNEIQITMLEKKNKEKLITIKIHTTTGIVTCQGNSFENFRDVYFPQLKMSVDKYEQSHQNNTCDTDHTVEETMPKSLINILDEEDEITPKTVYYATESDMKSTHQEKEDVTLLEKEKMIHNNTFKSKEDEMRHEFIKEEDELPDIRKVTTIFREKVPEKRTYEEENSIKSNSLISENETQLKESQQNSAEITVEKLEPSDFIEPEMSEQDWEEIDNDNYNYISDLTQSKVTKAKKSQQRKKYNIRGSPHERKYSNSSLDQIVKEMRSLRKDIEVEQVNNGQTLTEIKESLQRLEQKNVEMIVSINENASKISDIQTKLEINKTQTKMVINKTKTIEDWMIKTETKLNCTKSFKEESDNNLRELQDKVKSNCNENVSKMKDLLIDEMKEQQSEQIEVNREIWKKSTNNEIECNKIKCEVKNLAQEQESLVRMQNNLKEENTRVLEQLQQITKEKINRHNFKILEEKRFKEVAKSNPYFVSGSQKKNTSEIAGIELHQNKFESLSEDYIKKRKEPDTLLGYHEQTYPKQKENTNSNFDMDCVMFMNSHGSRIDERKLYKNKNIKINVLPQGEKNITGVRNKILNASGSELGKVNVIGVGDNDIKFSPLNAANDMYKLYHEFEQKWPEKQLLLLQLIERQDDEEHNENVRIFNQEISKQLGDEAIIKHNITSKKKYLYYDRIHLNDTGCKALARSLKEKLNPMMGLIPYSDYSKKANTRQNEKPYKRYNKDSTIKEVLINLLKAM